VVRADRLRADGLAAIEQAVIPAYAKVARFLAETYIPGARKTIAASDLPDGRAFYRAAASTLARSDPGLLVRSGPDRHVRSSG